MTTSPPNHARDTVIAALQADADNAGFVPATSIYPNKTPNQPVKPFLRSGVIDAELERLSGWIGANCDGAIHAFVGVTDAIPDAESFCQDLVHWVATTLDELPECIVDRTMVMRDREEADTYHGIVYYAFAAVGER